jgi:hypothetical protein
MDTTPRRTPQHRKSGDQEGLSTYTVRMTTYDIVLSPREAMQFLYRSAAEFAIAFCTIDDCDICQEFVDTWNSVFAALPEEETRELYAAMVAGEIVRPQVAGWGR